MKNMQAKMQAARQQLDTLEVSGLKKILLF